MVIDHSTIYPINDDEEFFDTLKTYEQEWFIGSENDLAFSQSIINNKEFLFNLYKDTEKVSWNYNIPKSIQLKLPILLKKLKSNH